MARIERFFADESLIANAVYSHGMIIDLGAVWQVGLSGLVAKDWATGIVAGYEAHNGGFAEDALEQQVAGTFRQAELLFGIAAKKIGRAVTFADVIETLVFLREDYPLIFRRFNDAYREEFKRRGVGVYPIRTTVMKVTLPEPNALVEIQFKALVEK